MVDVFISYAHIDDEEAGWVGDLHRALELRLRGLLGTQKIVIWRDPQVERIGSYKDDLRRTIANSAFFLSILSPRYIDSLSCRQEVDWFVAEARAASRSDQEIKSRLIRAVKTSIDDQPDVFDEDLGYEFYETDPAKPQFIREFGSRSGMDRYEKFRVLVDDLAQELKPKLRLLQKHHSTGTARSRSIFLARTSGDLEKYRASIQIELTGRGYTVLPSEPLPDDASQARVIAEDQLAKSDISIHLLGSRYGVIPELETRSFGELLYDMALSHRKRSGFHQLVWIAPGTENAEATQRTFLTKVRDALHESGAGDGDVLETTFESFKEGLLDIVTRQPQSAQIRAMTQAKSVYLVCDRLDLRQEPLRMIRAYLRKLGHPVELPPFQGEPETLRELEEDLIGDTDAALIYYGVAEDSWVQIKRRKVLKILSGKKKANDYARGLYLASPKDDLKAINYLDTPDGLFPEAEGFPPLLVLGDCDEFLPAQLKSFVEMISK